MLSFRNREDRARTNLGPSVADISWGQVLGTGWGFSRKLQDIRGRDRLALNCRICGRKLARKANRPHKAEVRILHGKEGVDGSSPSEGSRKGQQMAFFVASTRDAGSPSRPQPVPKTRPRIIAGIQSGLIGRFAGTEHLPDREVLGRG